MMRTSTLLLWLLIPIVNGRFLKASCNKYHQEDCIDKSSCVWCRRCPEENTTKECQARNKCVNWDVCDNKGKDCSKENSVTSDHQDKNWEFHCTGKNGILWLVYPLIVIFIIGLIAGIGWIIYKYRKNQLSPDLQHFLENQDPSEDDIYIAENAATFV